MTCRAAPPEGFGQTGASATRLRPARERRSGCARAERRRDSSPTNGTALQSVRRRPGKLYGRPVPVSTRVDDREPIRPALHGHLGRHRAVRCGSSQEPRESLVHAPARAGRETRAGGGEKGVYGRDLLFRTPVAIERQETAERVVERVAHRVADPADEDLSGDPVPQRRVDESRTDRVDPGAGWCRVWCPLPVRTRERPGRIDCRSGRCDR